MHYGDTTLFISDEMRGRGLGYASAVAMEEITLLDFNRRAGDGEKLVAVYPRDGTFFSDNPLMTLQGDWVSPEQRRAAEVFADFVAEQVTPELAGRHGFRPADEQAAPAGLVTRANGVDPAQPARVLRLPGAEGAGQDQAGLARRPQAGQRDDRLRQLRLDGRGEQARAGDRGPEGLLPRGRAAGPHRPDQVLGPDHAAGATIAPMRTNRDKLLAAADTIFPEDETRVRDATIAGVQAVEAALDPDAINAVVVLTDGEDTSSGRSADAVVRELEAQRRKESGQVRVFTIAYGSEPNADELAAYAKASGGNSYKGGGEDIASIYRSISSFF